MPNSPHSEWILLSQSLVLPEKIAPGGVHIRDGRILRVLSSDETQKRSAGIPVIDAGQLPVLPGLVDTHAHINEPGRTEWEGFVTATRAACAGGITTVIDMPLNSIPATTTLEALHVKEREAQGRCSIDYGFWGGVVPGNAHELVPMIRAGVMGFKCFLIESGVEEFKHVGEAELREVMPVLASNRIPLLVHAELDTDTGMPSQANLDPRRYETYLRSRPRDWENQAIRMVIELARKTGCRTHIVHLSSSDAIADLARARREGVPISAETCPHYLAIQAEDIPDGATHFKCAPPIREHENRERLWKGLAEGDVSFIVSDHSPCTPHLKNLEKGDFLNAWGGISSIQFSLPVVWTEMKSRSLGLSLLARWMSAETAKFAGLAHRKGHIAEGMDADLVIFDPEAEVRIDPSTTQHRHKLTPYSDRVLKGRVLQTFLRGTKIFDRGGFGEAPAGMQCKREN